MLQDYKWAKQTSELAKVYHGFKIQKKLIFKDNRLPILRNEATKSESFLSIANSFNIF